MHTRAARHALYLAVPQPFRSYGPPPARTARLGAMDPAAKCYKAPTEADLSTAAPSTGGGSLVLDDPMEGGYASDGSMKTGTAAKSFKSGEGSSRSNQSRGPAYLKKKQARQDARFGAIQDGIDRGVLPNRLSPATRQSTAELATGVTGDGARGAHASLLQNAASRAQQAYPVRTQRQATADWLARPPPPPRGTKVIRRADGTVMCALCDKEMTDGHLSSIQHRARAEEDAIGTLMAGDAVSARRFARGGHGMPGIPTKSALLAFWGDALPNMPVAAWRKLSAEGLIDVGDKTTRPLTVDKIAGLRLGIVSYAGASAGKYNGNAFHYFDDLPDCLDVYDDARYGDGPNPWARVGPAPIGRGLVASAGSRPRWRPAVVGGHGTQRYCGHQEDPGYLLVPAPRPPGGRVVARDSRGRLIPGPWGGRVRARGPCLVVPPDRTAGCHRGGHARRARGPPPPESPPRAALPRIGPAVLGHLAPAPRGPTGAWRLHPARVSRVTRATQIYGAQ